MTRRSNLILLFLSLICLVSITSQQLQAAENASSKSQPKTITLKVFWIGNSYTASGNLPQLVTNMMAEGRTKYRMDASHHWVGGKGWDHHVEETNVLSKISAGNYDYVVLQDYSYAPTHRKEKMRKYGKILADAIKDSGATPVYYNTWAKAHLPNEADEINGMYHEVALANDGILAPVGAAWQYLIDNKDKHNLTLHLVDRSHPSAQGTYLNAAIFYSVFTGKSPVGLKFRKSKGYIMGKGQYEKLKKKHPNLNNDNVDTTHANTTINILQKAAWYTIQKYQKENKIPVTAKQAELIVQ
ncbi:hypothetical protein KS4_34970 [Poriferisphaera corsica]|uniref:SGNH/GDSL hydrolase family protein n=1 Tax=Poriferisphaera corsica TaxID=2528020 RepID=A0A517YYX3_9BACT|nr:hypothetical protein [Poriferisphaera corsica]QDU35416.1 hypothetical protein KS4_34970 [Poriferisphaera corsica]